MGKGTGTGMKSRLKFKPLGPGDYEPVSASEDEEDEEDGDSRPGTEGSGRELMPD